MSFGKMGGKGPREPRVERQSVPDRTPAPIRVSRQAKVDDDDEESSVWYIWAAMIGGLLLIVLATCWLVANQYDQIASQSSDARSTRGKFDFSHTFAMTGVRAAHRAHGHQERGPDPHRCSSSVLPSAKVALTSVSGMLVAGIGACSSVTVPDTAQRPMPRGFAAAPRHSKLASVYGTVQTRALMPSEVVTTSTA